MIHFVSEWEEIDMKKVLSVLVAMVLTLCLCSFASAEQTAYHVGICQLVQHVALDAATQGFQDALKETGRRNRL